MSIKRVNSLIVHDKICLKGFDWSIVLIPTTETDTTSESDADQEEQESKSRLVWFQILDKTTGEPYKEGRFRSHDKFSECLWSS